MRKRSSAEKSTQSAYQPTYGVAPGRLLQECLETRGLSAREFARRCGRSAKLIVEIVAGKAPIEPDTALQFERVIGIDADLWLNMESSYRLHLAKTNESSRLTVDVKWGAGFPIREMERRGLVGKIKDRTDAVRKLLKFFGVGSVDACRERFAELAAVSYRHSPSFKSHEAPLMVWLRVGELQAEEMTCAEFNRTRFLEALRAIRQLTRKTIDEFIPEMTERCAAAGVVFLLVRPFDKIALSGISRWLNPRKGLIQQTLRHMSNDHFWFTFYHEAAHLLLHSRKSVFIDGKNLTTGNASEEEEANNWAANFLVPHAALEGFIESGSYSAGDVVSFAEQQVIATGIVVGQLQKREVIPYNHLNGLKDRYRWSDESTD